MSADSAAYKTFTADGLIYNGANQLYGVSLTGVGGATTLTLYDWTDATGGAVIHTLGAASGETVTVMFDKPVSVRKGIYADIGTNGSATVYTDGDYTTTSTTTTSTSTSTSTTAT